MGKIFGGSKQKSTSTSSNKAYDQQNQTFSPVTNLTGSSANAMSALLNGDTSGFNAFKDATGFNALTEQGSRGITGNAAAGGLLRSGGTGKALQNYGQAMNSQFADNYFSKLLSQAQLGLGAGNLIAGAGQTSNSTSSSKSKPGLGGLLGGAGSLIAASDRRLKKDVKKLRELEDGLGVYEYKYIDDTGPFVGVMADEVAKLRPEALGPVIRGYATVDYAKIGGL